MTEGGDLDKLGRGTVWRGELPVCLHQNHVFAVRPQQDVLDSEYLAFMTQSLHGRCYFESTGSRTTNLASTNSSKILSFPIPLPAMSEQKEIVRRIDSNLTTIQQAVAKVTRQVELLKERRQALITAAVTGQFDVSTASGRNVTDGIGA
jgi:type I restriction enzyme, S subunit